MRQNFKNFYIENKNMLGVLCLFIIIQPFLDISCLFNNSSLEIFGLTIPTIIRCGFIGILALISLKHINKNRDYLFLFIYFILLFIYIIFHHVIASNNDIIIPDNYTYSLFSELFYIVRMVLPLALIYFTRYSEINYKKFINSILITSLIIGLIIFIGNTYCISLTSYTTDTSITKLNWICWFTSYVSGYEFAELTSKGWFYMANQVGGVMMLLLPFNIYDMLKKSNRLNVTSSLLLIISMIMVGSRTASYGWLLIVICFVLILLYLRYIKKEKWWSLKRIYPFIIISLIGLIFLSVSPINTRSYGYELGDITTLEDPPTDMTKNNIDNVYKYITESYAVYGIQSNYIYELYNYKFDTKFWIDTFNYSRVNGVIENREMQTFISNRIDELNKEQLKYKLFGYSFSRMRNGGVYMEHDFVIQIFTMGYLGLLLLIGPYIYIMILASIKILKKMKSQPKLIDFVFMISICAMLGTSLFTGHLLDELFVMIYAGFICGFFLKRVSTKEVKIDEKN